MRSDLQYWRSFWFAQLLMASAAVAAGVLLELPEVWRDMTLVLRRRSPIFRAAFPRCDDRMGERDRTPDWIRLIAFIGLIFVASGVIGEGVSEAMISGADDNIQTFNDVLLAETAKEADSVAKQSADLLTRYQTAQRDLLALQGKIAPRRLSSSQKDVLRRRLSGFRNKSIFVGCTNPGDDGGDFAQDFLETFKSPQLGFRVQSGNCLLVFSAGFTTNFPPLQVGAGADRQRDADILIKALAEIGIRTKDIVKKTISDRQFLGLTIGPKAR